MKIKALIASSLILIISSLNAAEDTDKKFILGSMSFTVPGLKFGSLINNPMFALNISNKKVND